MPDDRPLRAKLEAMAKQTASPEEATIARAMLKRLDRHQPRNESRRALGREAILATPDRTNPARTVRWKGVNGVWFTADVDDFEDDFEFDGVGFVYVGVGFVYVVQGKLPNQTNDKDQG